MLCTLNIPGVKYILFILKNYLNLTCTMPWEMSTCETESLYLSGRQKRSLLKPGKSSGMDMQVVRSSEVEEDVVVILAVGLSERDWINGRRKET